MKHSLIKFPPDKVTISEQGWAASRRWHAGDKPFVQFIKEADVKSLHDTYVDAQEEVEQVEAVQAIDEGSGNGRKALMARSSRLSGSGDQLALDIGSRLEIAAPLKVNTFIIRSTTRVNLGEGPQTCETHWEVIPNDSE